MDPNPEPETLTAWPCAVDVCERSQIIGDGCVCDTCADMSWHHGPHDDDGNRLCDECGVILDEASTYGVTGGEGSADWLCHVCMADVQIELACCDRHAMNPDHAGPCAAWLNSPDTDDGCEVVE